MFVDADDFFVIISPHVTWIIFNLYWGKFFMKGEIRIEIT